jgi:hypothetical protein
VTGVTDQMVRAMYTALVLRYKMEIPAQRSSCQNYNLRGSSVLRPGKAGKEAL